MGVSTRLAALDDVSSWLEIAVEVEGLFGPMPDFDSNIRRGVDWGDGACNGSGSEVAGATLLSRDGHLIASTG